jgi:tripartite-type tricarboxylate transporter receptor subunit TctC
MYMINYSVFDRLDRAGKLKLIATATPTRLSVRPELPTISESGLLGYTVNVWYGIAAPATTPAPILDKAHADVVKVLQDVDFTEKVFKPIAAEAGGNSRSEFAADIRQEFARWAELVKTSGAKLD